MRLALALLLTVLGPTGALLRDFFSNVLPFPGHASRGAFSDRGAWQGFALPDPESAGGFAGPFIQGTWTAGDHWLSKACLARFVPEVTQNGSQLAPSALQSHFVPGLLQQSYRLGALHIESELAFVGRHVAGVRVVVSNPGPDPLNFRVAFNGSATVPLALKGGVLVAANFSAKAAEAVAAVHLPSGLEPQIAGQTFAAKGPAPRPLQPSARFEVYYYAVSLALNASEHLSARREADVFLDEPEGHFAASQQRWEQYLHSAVGEIAPSGPTLRQRIAAKAVSTLALNWRGATGTALLHDGLTPSITGFSNGLWSWDSWKHAAGLALFDTALAKSQVRAMFDHQGKRAGPAFVGMVPDKVGLPPNAGDAWDNTKPPLAAWAVSVVHEHSRDTEFLREVFPKLESYHHWWYTWRDHDRNGLCEFGASVAGLMQMKWESGMDNAPRFDNTSLLKNSDHAWSATQESVDLNSFLYLEKRILAAMARELGNTSLAAAYKQEADSLQALVQERFFDKTRGYFFDRTLGSNGTFVGPMGCEGFAPLWTGLASAAQAARVREHLLDPASFRTKVPFPCVAANAPEFEASGYWRGPVWLDQAFFALGGLRSYGFASDADQALGDLLASAEGLGAGDPAAPFTENYHPHTGARQGAEWFGWSAAHLLLLTAGQSWEPMPKKAFV